MQPYILIVEDEEAIASLIEYNLQAADFKTKIASDGQEALDAVDEKQPDLMILDWMLPIYDGIEVCKRIRENIDTAKIPILMLTARGEETDRILGFDVGADDYMVKPFSPKELIARINAILRRTRPVLVEKKLEFGGIEIDIQAHQVIFNGKNIRLGPTEFRLLGCLMENPNQVFSREQLLDNVWGLDVYVESRTVDVHIQRLRKALESAGVPDYINTVRSVGYILQLNY